MAKTTREDVKTRVLWIAGGAAVSAFAIFFVNKAMNEREELKRLQLAELAKSSSGD